MVQSKDRETAAGTRVLVQCGTYGTGTILRPAPDGFHGHRPHRIWWVRLDDDREIQVEQDLLQLEGDGK